MKILNKNENTEFRQNIDKLKDDTEKKDLNQPSRGIKSEFLENSMINKGTLAQIGNQLTSGGTGSNGNYEDVKMKFEFDIVNENGDIIHDSGTTGGIERQFAFSDNENESGESNHEVALDTEKVLDSLAKVKANLGLDEIINTYKGGINRHIATMRKWNNPDYEPSNDKKSGGITKQFIDQQFKKRNYMTFNFNGKEYKIIFSNGLNEVEEKALISYLIQKQINQGKMMFFHYEKDLKSLGFYPDNKKVVNQQNGFPKTMSEINLDQTNDLHKHRFIRQSTYQYLLTGNIPRTGYIKIDGKVIPVSAIAQIIDENPCLAHFLNEKMKGNKPNKIRFS